MSTRGRPVTLAATRARETSEQGVGADLRPQDGADRLVLDLSWLGGSWLQLVDDAEKPRALEARSEAGQ